MKIVYSSKFERAYAKLTSDLKGLAEEQEAIFRNNPFNPVLRTHKLSGKLNGYWAFWIDYRNRIIFRFLKNNAVYFHTIGDHRIYKKAI